MNKEQRRKHREQLEVHDRGQVYFERGFGGRSEGESHDRGVSPTSVGACVGDAGGREDGLRDSEFLPASTTSSGLASPLTAVTKTPIPSNWVVYRLLDVTGQPGCHRWPERSR